MKKMICFLLLTGLCIGLFTGCSQNGGAVSPGSEQAQKVKIGIAQIMEHPSLNTIRESILAELKVQGYEDGVNCTIEYKNAQSNQSNLAPIMQAFKNNNMDIIIAIATPTVAAAAPYAEDIPVVFAACENPVESGFTSTLEKPDKNITGTSDRIPVASIIDMALTIKPDIKTLGLLYNKGESNSASSIKTAKEYALSKNIEVVEATVTNTSEVQQAARVLASKVDAIFSPTDNTVASAMPAVTAAATEAKVPVFVGADSMVNDGGLATIGINYTVLGKETAQMAAEVLKGKDISEIPVKEYDQFKTYLNLKTAKDIGITIPESILNGSDTEILVQE